jgi:hypothetical protein
MGINPGSASLGLPQGDLLAHQNLRLLRKADHVKTAKATETTAHK